MRFFLIILILFSTTFPVFVSAKVLISEIMYAPNEGVAHEWFEIFNNGASEVDITDWRFNDGSNHVFGKPPKNGGQGSLIIPSGAYAIVAKEADTFLSAHYGFSNTVIDGSFSLTDTGDTLLLIDGDGVTVDTVSYDENAGARKNELSLQLIDGTWTPSAPTPGVGVLPLPQEQEQEEDQSESSSSSTSTGGGSPVEPQIFAYINSSGEEDSAELTDVLKTRIDTLDFSQLENFNFVECFVNTACPRLIDDYDKFHKAILNIDYIK